MSRLYQIRVPFLGVGQNQQRALKWEGFKIRKYCYCFRRIQWNIKIEMKTPETSKDQKVDNPEKHNLEKGGMMKFTK